MRRKPYARIFENISKVKIIRYTHSHTAMKRDLSVFSGSRGDLRATAAVLSLSSAERPPAAPAHGAPTVRDPLPEASSHRVRAEESSPGPDQSRTAHSRTRGASVCTSSAHSQAIVMQLQMIVMRMIGSNGFDSTRKIQVRRGSSPGFRQKSDVLW